MRAASTSWSAPTTILDLVPKGRDEAGLSFTMDWVRHHDRYPDDGAVHGVATGSQPTVAACPACASAAHG